MKFNPLHDRVIVQRSAATTQTTGGIFIPDSVAEKPDQGVVLAVGAGYRTESGELVPMSMAVNDRVLFAKTSGQLVKIEGQELLVMKESEIFAVIEEN